MKECAEQDKLDFYRRATAAVGPHSLQVQMEYIEERAEEDEVAETVE